ncbi:MAG TPA: tail fiber domain-containing protein [Rugosimonospora sp.]|nr:tail fiber domain-containing protein [Rugosimonospora sp.]
MADTFTPHYNLTKPQVGGDPDTWGNLLNANFDAIDSAIWDARNYALPLTGGTVTGATTFNVRPTFNGKTPWDSGNLPNPVLCTSANSVKVAWGSGQLGLTVDTTPLGNIWHTGNLDPSDYAALNSAPVFSGGALAVNGSSDVKITVQPTGGAQIGLASTSTPNKGIYDYTNSTWLVRWDTSQNATFAGNIIAQGGVTASGSLTASGGTVYGGAGINIGGTTAGAVALRPQGAASATNQAVLDTGGNLTLAGALYAGQNFISTTGNWVAGPTGAGNIYLRPNGIGSTSGQVQVASNGLVTGTDFQATSDARLKADVQPLRRGLDALKHMLPRQYVKYSDETHAGEGKVEVGFLAQEVREVLPEAVDSGSDGYLGVSHGQVTALLAAALLELDTRLAALEAAHGRAG